MLSKILFCLKQLLPLKYETTTIVTDDSGENEFIRLKTTWCMWLGKPFLINHYRL